MCHALACNSHAKTDIKVGVQLKKVLSANPEATINVECIMNDIDVAGKMTRDLFEEKSASVLQSAKAPLQKVIKAAL